MFIVMAEENNKNIFILIDKILEGLTEGQFSKLIDHVIDNITDSHIQTLFNNTDFCEKLLENLPDYSFEILKDKQDKYERTRDY